MGKKSGRVDCQLCSRTTNSQAPVALAPRATRLPYALARGVAPTKAAGWWVAAAISSSSVRSPASIVIRQHSSRHWPETRYKLNQWASVSFSSHKLNGLPTQTCLHFQSLAMALRAPLARAANRATSTVSTPALSTYGLQWKRGNATVAPVKQDVATGSKGPTAMVFMNMGGPSTTDEVHGFLSMLFVNTLLHNTRRVQS